MTTKEKVVPVSATTWQPVMIACHGDTAVQDMICQYSINGCCYEASKDSHSMIMDDEKNM